MRIEDEDRERRLAQAARVELGAQISQHGAILEHWLLCPPRHHVGVDAVLAVVSARDAETSTSRLLGELEAARIENAPESCETEKIAGDRASRLSESTCLLGA